MTELDVLERLEKDSKSMEEVGTALLRRDRPGVVAALTRWVVGAVSGLPALGALAQQTVTRAFTNTATAAIEAELAALEAEAARRAFIHDIATAVEPLIQQAVVQLVRVQHNLDETRRNELIAALGGLRPDLANFRAAFARDLERSETAVPEPVPAGVHIGRQRVSGTGVGVVARGSGDTPVRIDWQEVLDQGVGLRVSGRARVFIADQDVRGGVGVEQE